MTDQSQTQIHPGAPAPGVTLPNSFQDQPRLLAGLVVATCFGMIAGGIEGIGLLLFQRMNWQRWGPMVHVSKGILWISPIVDVLLFLFVAIVVALGMRALPRFSSLRVTVFALTFLAAYDWLTLTERLSRIACLLLGLGAAASLDRRFLQNQRAFVQTCTKSVPWLLGIWLATFGFVRGADSIRERHELAQLPTASATAPNVLVIVIDTLRADHLSSYGYTRQTTPNIDRIASQGVLFRNAISACSWTLPSHASLLTGRYPSDHGMQNAQSMPWFGWGNKSLRGYRTLGEALERKGYRTGAFSANQTYFTSHIGLGRGFTHFEDYFQSPADMFLRTLYGREFERTYLRRTEKSKITRAIRCLGLSSLLDNRKRADEVNRETLAWIERGQRPFFAFLNYIDVHDASSLRWVDSKPAWGLKDSVDQYDSALTYVDAEIGELLDQLQQRGLAANTLVIITSDHGESLGQHDMQYHGIALYLEQIHVPLLLWRPGKVPAGTKVDQPVSLTSLPTTVLDVLDGSGQNTFPGSGLGVLWNQAGGHDWPSPISELAKNEIVTDPDRQARRVLPTSMDGDMKSIVTPQWHMILHQTLGDQLYDWVADPDEKVNLASTPEGSKVVSKLKSQKPF